jgi:hypothetical protein
MAFRLTCWTNGLFMNAPVGRTFHYAITNAIGEEWDEYVEVMGDTYVASESNNYRTVWTEEWYSAPDLIPSGTQARGAIFLRSDEDSAYVLDSGMTPGPMQEDLVWKKGPIGTTWSYFASSPHTLIHSTITATNVTVTIGSTNYTGCIEIHSVGEPQPWLTDFPNRQYTEWIKPGGYVVKRENWWIYGSLIDAAPVVYELQGWTDQ